MVMLHYARKTKPISFLACFASVRKALPDVSFSRSRKPSPKRRGLLVRDDRRQISLVLLAGRIFFGLEIRPSVFRHFVCSLRHKPRPGSGCADQAPFDNHISHSKVQINGSTGTINFRGSKNNQCHYL